MKKLNLFLVLILTVSILSFMPVYASNFTVSADDTNPKINIEQYNQQHIKNLLNEAFNRAALIVDKKAKLTKPGFSAEGGSFYTEGFDHYVYGSGYQKLRGFLINYTTARSGPGPQTITVSTDSLKSYAGSVQVSGKVTTELKNAIIGGISTKLGVSTTWQTTAQTNIHIGDSAQVPAGSGDNYTLSM